MKSTANITLLIGLVIFMLAFACTNDKKSAATQEEQDTAAGLSTQLGGTWQTIQLNVAINSAFGRDTFATEQLAEGTWTQMGMNPPTWYFMQEAVYKLVNKTLQGQKLHEETGNWQLNGDTLTIAKPDSTTQVYLVKIGQGRATLRTTLDWDSDGEIDDVVQSLIRQVSIGTQE